MNNEDERSEPGFQSPNLGPFSENIKHTPISARVPENVTRGAVATATMILQTDDVFVLDFLSTMLKPQRVAARVVVTVPTFTKMIAALQQNVKKYEQRFGTLSAHSMCSAPAKDAPPAGRENDRPDSGEATPATDDQAPRSEPPLTMHSRIAELYNDLTLPDDVLGGVFANTVMVSHTAEEFSFDFIANFYPRSVVTSRVFLAAGRIPSLLQTLCNSLKNYRESSADKAPGEDPSPPS